MHQGRRRRGLWPYGGKSEACGGKLLSSQVSCLVCAESEVLPFPLPRGNWLRIVGNSSKGQREKYKPENSLGPRGWFGYSEWVSKKNWLLGSYFLSLIHSFSQCQYMVFGGGGANGTLRKELYETFTHPLLEQNLGKFTL